MEYSQASSFSRVLPFYLVIFFGFVGYSLMLTVFTPMLMHSHMMHRTLVLGFLLSAYPLGQFLGSPIIGALSDHFGRKRVLVLSLLIATAMYALIACNVHWHAVVGLMLTSFMAGLFESNIAIALSAIADVSEGAERTKLFGYINFSASIAYIVGPLLGGKLTDANAVAWFNQALPFWLVGGCLLMMALYSAWMVPADKPRDPTLPIPWLASITNVLHVFRPSRIRRYYLINFLLYLAVFGFLRCYPMYIVNAFGMSLSQESNYIAWVSVPIILANLGLIGWLAKRMSSQSTCIVFALLLMLMMIIVVLPANPGWLWLTLFLLGLCAAFLLPNAASLISAFADDASHGRVMGNNQALQVAAETIAGTVGGALAAIAIPLSMLGMAAFAAIAALLLMLLKPQESVA